MISIHRANGAARDLRTRRLIAIGALAATAALGTTGCSMISPQATTIQYSAAEGVNIYDNGPLDVRNAYIVATDDGAEGNFVAAIVNDTDEAHTLRIEIGEGGGTEQLSVRVPARTTISLGAEGEDPLLVEGLDTPPGADVPGYFQSGEGEGALISVPVLDGALPYLAPLVP